MKKLKKLSAFIFALGMLSVTTLPYSVSALENTVTSDNPISEEVKNYPKNWTYYKTVSDEEVYEEYKNYWISHGYGERYNWDDKDSVIQSFFSALKNDNTDPKRFKIYYDYDLLDAEESNFIYKLYIDMLIDMDDAYYSYFGFNDEDVFACQIDIDGYKCDSENNVIPGTIQGINFRVNMLEHMGSSELLYDDISDVYTYMRKHLTLINSEFGEKYSKGNMIYPVYINHSVLPQEPTTTTTTYTVLGDTNCDGTVDISDAVLAKAWILNSEKYIISEQGIKNTDVIGNNGINTQDALAIQQYAVGLIDTF